jgi:phosphatidylglycerophosphate synthase
MKLGPADRITAVRAVLVALLVLLLGQPVASGIAWTVVAIALVAVLLDGVDGWVARRTGTASAFGMRFDMETDAALILALAILVWRHGKAGPWILGAGLLRYLFVGAGWVWPWMARPLAPTLRARVICVVQIAALILAVAPIVPPPASTVVAACGLAALSYSFLVDTLWLARGRRTT